MFITGGLPGAKGAIDTAIAVFEERYPNLKVVSNAVPGGAGGRWS